MENCSGGTQSCVDQAPLMSNEHIPVDVLHSRVVLFLVSFTSKATLPCLVKQAEAALVLTSTTRKSEILNFSSENNC